jgi:hypothetical protein
MHRLGRAAEEEPAPEKPRQIVGPKVSDVSEDELFVGGFYLFQSFDLGKQAILAALGGRTEGFIDGFHVGDDGRDFERLQALFFLFRH